MRYWMAAFGALMFAAGGAATTWWQTPIAAQGLAVVQDCGAGASSQLRTSLYFGTMKPKGTVSELEWQLFLRDEVTRRFPDGLTVWDADGQWKNAAGDIGQERSKVLLLDHPDTAAARQSVQQLMAEYRKQFDQESVLWESSRVCVAS
jgi:hypothetical protein